MLEYYVYKNHGVVARFKPSSKTERVIEIDSTRGTPPVPVTAIRESCFAGANIGLVTLPPSVTTIEDRAFFESAVTSIVTLRTPGELHLQEIGPSAFRYSHLDGHIRLFCNGTLDIGPDAFHGCGELEEIEILGSGTVKISARAFMNCIRLRVFRAMNVKITSLPEQVFAGCSELHTIAIPSLRHVGPRACAGCSSLYGFPAVLDSSYANSFEGCNNLKHPVNRKNKHKCADDTWTLPTPEEIQAMLETNDVPGGPFKSFYETYRDRQPIFSLKISPRSGSEKPSLQHPFIKGYFRLNLVQKDVFHFEITVPRDAENITLTITCEKKYEPLLTYLAKGSTIVQLTGMESEDGSLYNVFEVEPTLGNNTILTPAFFQEILARLSGRPRTDFMISSAAQARLFLDLMADSGKISSDIIRAIRQELKDFELQPSDIMKHRLQALKVLTTIDFTPTKQLDAPSLDVVKATLNKRLGGMHRAKHAILAAAAALHQGHMPARRGILFVGPPGTGKTRISQLCAKLLSSSPNGLPTIDLDFSSMNSPIDLTGSERDYSNGTYSILVRKALQTTERAMRACVHLGEVDKGSMELKYSLLGMLDGRFYDVYLSIPISTEQLFFVMTANSLDSLPPPLLSRLHIVHVDAYTRKEKHQILRDILIPEANANNNFTPGFQLQAAAEQLLLDYTEKAGIRELRGAINDIVDYYHLESEEHGVHQLKRVYTKNDIERILAPSATTYRPNYDPTPGEVRFLYTDLSGEPQMGVVQVAFSVSDNPKIEILGTTGGQQCDHVRMALTAIRSTSSLNLSEIDLTISFPEMIQSQQNIIGLPVFMAIHSCLREEPPTRNTLMIGSGVDLFGHTMLPKGPMTSLLKTAIDLGATTVLAPTGFSKQIDLIDLDSTPLIVETRQAGELVRFILKR